MITKTTSLVEDNSDGVGLTKVTTKVTRPAMRDMRDMRPLPETSEAVALGCTCNVARKADGWPHLDAHGRPLYAITKGCPVHS
jgi:hypothetical protein